MKDKKTLILTTLICLLPMIMGAVFYSQIPDSIAIHWNAQGIADNYASKTVGLFVLPGLLALLNLAMPMILKIDPKYENISDKSRTLIQWIIPCVSLFASGTTLMSALGHDVHIAEMAPVFMGVLFMIIGNFLPKMSQSYTVGIKLPWTLNNEENWNKTHRIGGFCFVIGGLLVIIAGFLKLDYMIIMIIFAAMVIIPTVYSYLEFRKHQ